MDTKVLKKECKKICKAEKRTSYILKLLSVIFGIITLLVLITAFALDYIPLFFTTAGVGIISGIFDIAGDITFKKEFAEYIKTKQV